MSDWKNELVNLLCNGEHEAARELRQRNLPNSIFRYRCCTDRDFATLERGTVWMDSPDNFNDLYDAKISLMGNRTTSVARAVWCKIMGLTNAELQDAISSEKFGDRYGEIMRSKDKNFTRKPLWQLVNCREGWPVDHCGSPMPKPERI
jgi:hypothetical protein